MTTTATPDRKLEDGMQLETMFRTFTIDECVKLPRTTKGQTETALRASLLESGLAERLGIKDVIEAWAPKVRAAGADDETDPDEEDEEDGPDQDRFAIAISSEYPVRRWFGKEILDHSPEAVDLSRAKDGLVFLDSHDMRKIIGRVDGVELQKKKLRGVARFSRSNSAQEVKRDVEDGIRKDISVGYLIDEYVLEKHSEDEGETYRATKWTPVEVSSVGVPADPTVGHDRADHRGGSRIHVRGLTPAASRPTTQTEVRVENGNGTQQIDQNRKDGAEIVRLGKVHGIDQERVASWIAEGRSVDAVSREILDEVAKRTPTLRVTAAETAEREAGIVLNDKEQKEYNLARGILAMAAAIHADGERGEPENCLEIEVSRTIEKQWRRATHGGLFVPWSLKHVQEVSGKRAGLDSKTATAGQELKFTEPGTFIEFLYNRMRVKELGAQTVSGLRDNVAYPKQTGRATGTWVGENPGSDVADSALTLGQVPTSPKTYQSSTSYSRQLLAQAVIDVDTLVREDLARDMALASDLAAIAGTGTLQPTGVLHTSGITSYVNATEATTNNPGYDDVIHMLEQLEDSNADQLGDPAFLTTPAMKSYFKLLPRLANTIALPAWTDDDELGGGYMARSTNQVPKVGNTTHHTGSDQHALILGVWRTLVISSWGSGFELVVDPYRLKKQGMIELTTFMLMDVALKYAAAFVVSENNPL